jgi:integrase
MAKPWAKRSKWPYVAKSGRKSYGVGFYDHQMRETTRMFPTVRHARAWMDDYITAERRRRESLRRFLLDLDAKEANQAEESRSLAEVLELYLSASGHPSNQGGLAPATYERYRSTIGKHLTGKPRALKPGGRSPPGETYAVKLGKLPARGFSTPQAPRGWREQMVREGVPKPTRDHAWHVLSAALSWAAASQLVPEIQTNGCSLATEPRVNRRRSVRVGGTGEAPNPRKHGLGVASWALSPRAVEAIRQDMLARTSHRDPILAQRDATIVSLQYGLGARNQEVWALRWRSIVDEYMWVQEMLSHGILDEWGKTEDSVQRRTLMPAILLEDLAHWRTVLQAWGHPARAVDFIIPGDLAGARYGIREPHTDACHLTANQAKAWGSKSFTPAVKHVATRSEFMHVLGATPYSLRRGGISLRLRAEDPQTVASECGTSLKMLSSHYAYAIQDLRRNGPRSADVEWREARATQAAQTVASDEPKPEGGDWPNRRRLLAWLSTRRRASGGS